MTLRSMRVTLHSYRYFDMTWDDKVGISTLIFNVNILMQLVNEFNGRHLQFTWNLAHGVLKNNFFIPILIIIAAVQVLLIQVAYDFVDCKPFTLNQWAGCAIIALCGIPMGWIHQLMSFGPEKPPERTKVLPGGAGVEMV
jgi:magnesium-transporting ATPase (P-type)